MTQEEFNNTDFIKLFASILNVPVEELLKEINTPTEELLKGTNTANNVEDDDQLYPLSVGEFKQLIYDLQNIYIEANKYGDLGIKLNETGIGQAVLRFIEYLLSIIFNDEFAREILTRIVPNKDPDEIVYDLIDYLNE